MTRQYLVSTAAVVALFTGSAVAGSAFAQTASKATSSVQLEEVLVTAQKRSENLQSVPIAITSVSAGVLKSAGVLTTSDLGMVVPSVSFNQSAGAIQTYIRGIGTAISIGGNEASVATYVDGVYYASSTASVLLLNNISQISVLKGPQGTLFGRNATGGVIQITTRDPSQEFQGEANATIGNYGTYGVSAYVTGGITPNLAADLAIRYYDQTEGLGKNLFSGQDVSKERDFSARSKWKAELGPATTATLIVDYQDINAVSPAMRPAGTSPTLIGPFTGGRFDENSNIVKPHQGVRQYGASLDLRHDLGPVKLVSITAYRHSAWKNLFDSDTMPLDIFSVDYSSHDAQFSEELQIVSNDNTRLKWVAGLYYLDAYGTIDPVVVGGTLINMFQTINSRQTTKSIAAFVQGTYAFTDRTSLTVGFRETGDTKTIHGSGKIFVPSPGITIPQGPYEAEATVYKPTWRIALDHKLTDDVMAYVSYNHSFKNGGYDPAQNAVAKYFVPEVLDAYEIGLKSELFDRRVRFNTAGFYYDFKNPQLNTIVNSLPAVYNGTGAKVYGIDLDMTALLTEGLTVTAGLSALHGRYEAFPTTHTILTPMGVVQGPDVSADGKKLQNTPAFQAKLGGNYLMHLANENTLDFSVNYSYQSKMFVSPENRLFQPGYSLVNASVTWSSDEAGRYTAQLWGKNLGDTVYATELHSEVGLVDLEVAAPGRTFGVTLGTKF